MRSQDSHSYVAEIPLQEAVEITERLRIEANVVKEVATGIIYRFGEATVTIHREAARALKRKRVRIVVQGICPARDAAVHALGLGQSQQAGQIEGRFPQQDAARTVSPEPVMHAKGSDRRQTEPLLVFTDGCMKGSAGKGELRRGVCGWGFAIFGLTDDTGLRTSFFGKSLRGAIDP